jgi:L-lactate dehydrogenase complex protein LldG
MSGRTQSRGEVLKRVHSATRNTVPGDTQSLWSALPRDYGRRGTLGAEARIGLMVERLREYEAEVVQVRPEALPEAISARLAGSRRHRFVAPGGLPQEWRAEGFEWILDHQLTAEQIEWAEGVVTTCFCAIADSGTIVLHHSSSEGRRVLSLLPDWHLCILRASQIVETLPEYFSCCHHPPTLATWISGPSATADIEMTRIKGVHGPRHLEVLLVRDHESSAILNIETGPSGSDSGTGKG